MAIPDNHENTGTALLSPDLGLRRLLTAAIKRSGKKRPQIAEEMTPLVGVRVTESMLNDFTATSKRGVRFPAAWLSAFCIVTMDDGPSLALLSAEHRARLEIKEKLAELRSMIATLLAAEERRERSNGRSPHASKVNGRGANK